MQWTKGSEEDVSGETEAETCMRCGDEVGRHPDPEKRIDLCSTCEPIVNEQIRVELLEQRHAALLEAAKVIAALLPSIETLDALEDDARSGRRPLQMTVTIRQARALHAALASEPTP